MGWGSGVCPGKALYSLVPLQSEPLLQYDWCPPKERRDTGTDAQREELGNDRKLEWYIISQKKKKKKHPELWKTLEIRRKGGKSFSSRAFREGIALSTL